MEEQPKKQKGFSNSQKVKGVTGNRILHMGIHSTAVSVGVVAIATAIMMLVSWFPKTYTRLDITSQRLISISEQTENLLDGLQDEIQIYLIYSSGSEDTTIMGLLSRYESRSDKIKITRVDPVISPNFASQYTDETVLDNSMVVKCGERYKYVGYTDIYEADYSNLMTTGDYSTYFNGESVISGAIDYVTRENLPKVYNLVGHGEKVLMDKLANEIKNQNMHLKELDLLTMEGVPEDADCVIIVAPTADIPNNEKDMLLDYLKTGGRMLLFTDYSKTQMPNLEEITDNYGVEKVDGIIVEADTSLCMGNYYQYLLPQMVTHTITNPFIRNNYRVLAPIAQGLIPLDDTRKSVKVSGLLRTSAASFSKLAGYDMTTYAQEDVDIDGPFDIGIAITEAVGSKETRIVWYSTSNLLNEDANNTVSGANQDLILNSLNWMCQREDSISILAKTLDGGKLTVSSRESTFWSLVLIGIVPAAFVIAGIMVYIRRKNL